MSDWRKKNAVYIVSVPESFKPARPWDLPDSTAASELYCKNLALTEAQAFARFFNRRQLKAGLPDAKWAIVVKHTRRLWIDHADSLLRDGPPAAAGSDKQLDEERRDGQ